MSHVSDALISRLRREEYTGANRCLPCTILNLVLVAILAGSLAALHPWLGLGTALVGLVSIWLRGYLVPGTPWLTATYLPRRMLDLFHSTPGGERFAIELDAGVDPETVLREHGVLESDPTGTDLAVPPAVSRAWRDAVAAVTAAPSDEVALSRLSGVPAEDLRFTREGSAYVARIGHEKVGVWESRSAFIADAAADRVFADRIPGWHSDSLARRTAILGAFRIFLERCPTCDGVVLVERDVVDSCCRSVDVYAGTCVRCGDRLFEIDVADVAEE